MTEKTPLIPPRLLEQTTFSASWSFPSVAAVRSLDYDAGRRAGRRRLHLAVFAATMATMSNGFSIGYSSSALPDLRQRMGLNDDQGDWFGSVLNMGAMVGALAGGQLLKLIGRKYTLLAACPVNATGWLCIIAASVPGVLYFGRVVRGFSMGLMSLTVPVFISEISPKDIRGLLLATSTLSFTLGVLLSSVLGKWMGYEWLAISCMIPEVLMALTLPWVADSPRWLLQVNREEDASRSLQFYRGPDVDEEFKAMKANVADTGQFRMSELKQPYLYKPLLYTLLVLFLQQFSGVAVLLVYTRDVFVMSGSTLSAADSSIIMNAVPVLSVGAAAVLTDRLGRRILLLISLAVSGLSLAAVGAFYHFKQIRDEVSFVQSFGWLPLASLCVFFLGFSVGLRPLAYILMGEMLPLRIRSFAAGTLMCFFYACATLTTKEYHDMLTFFGQDGLFWFYGSIMAAGFVMVMVLLPETKGKSLEEIEQLFGKKQEVHSETG
ncbi:facilitated trehalose transporter Tret1 [Ixodes scapularis]